MSLWDDLSMREKAAMMRVAVKNKIFEIDKIKEAYDSQGKLVSNSEVINPNLYTPSVNLNVNPALDYVGNALESISGYEYEGNPLNKLGIDMSFDLGTTGSRMYPNGIKFVKKFGEGGNYTVGNLVDAIYLNNPKEEHLGRPSHNYDFTQSEEWANAHGYYPDARGHRDDRVKKPAHPSHPSRGTWQGDNFILTDKGFEDPNYTLFGLNDGGQDPLATLIYDDAIVLPEITVTPNGNYINNSYDNIRLHLKSNGGKINRFDDGGSKKSKNSDWPESYPKSLLPYEDVLNYLKSLNVTIDGLLYAFPWENAVLLLTSRGSHFYAPDAVAKRVADYYELVLNQAYDYDPSLKNKLNSYRLNLYTRDFLILRNAAYNSSILNSPSLAAKVKPNYRDPNKFAEALQYWASLETPYKKVVVPKKQNEKGQSSLDQSLNSIGSFFKDMGDTLSSINESGLQLANASKHSLESVQRANRKANLVLDSMESSAEQSRNLPGIVYDAAQVAGQENLERRDEQYKSRDMFMNSLQTALGLHGLIGNTANMFPNLAYRTAPAGIGTTLSPTLLGSIAYFKPWNASRSMLAGIALDATQAFLDPTEGGKLHNVGEAASGLAGLVGFSDVLLKVPKIGKALDFTFDAIGVLLNAKDATNFVTNFDLYAVDRLNKMIEDSNSEEPAK